MHEFDDSDPNDPNNPSNWESFESGPAEGDTPPSGDDPYQGPDPDLLPPADQPEDDETAQLEGALQELFGRMFPSEQSDAPRPMPESYRPMHEAVINKVAQGVEEYVPGVASDDEQVGYVVAGMAVEAAQADDVVAVEKYVDAMSNLGDNCPSSLRAHAYYAGVHLGSKQASTLLGRMLALEQSEMRQHQAARHGSLEQYGDDMHTVQRTLSAVAEACEALGVSPENWINQWAEDGMTLWANRVDYCRKAVEAGRQVQSHQAMLDWRAGELAGLSPLAENDEFVFTHAKEALDFTADPMVRAEVADRFLEAVSNSVPLTERTFEKLVRFGERLIKDADPVVATPPRILNANRLIGAAAQALTMGGQPKQVRSTMMRWNAAVEQHYHVAPERVLRRLDKDLTDLMQLPPDPGDAGRDPETEQYIHMARRDVIAGEYAEQYAAAGEFESAKAMLTSVVIPEHKQTMTAECLKHVQTPEQLAQVRPDEAELLFDDALREQFERTAVRVSGDVALMAEKGLTYAREYTGDIAEQTFIEEMYDTIAMHDQDRAVAYAREAIAILREQTADLPYLHTSGMSERLIAAGDSDEPQLAYDEISRMGDAPRLHALWRFAHRLAGKDIPVDATVI